MIKSRETTLKGLTEEQQKTLLRLVKPRSENNPFSESVQVRNQLIVLMLYHLGLRAGELLSLRISDFDFQNNTLLVAKRHDNPADPRTHQPVVKTIDRRIPLAESLMKAVSEYIMLDRRRYPDAKKMITFLSFIKKGLLPDSQSPLKDYQNYFVRYRVLNPVLKPLPPMYCVIQQMNDFLS
jgi:integrase